ncbi:aldehyde dehydrogenase family protein [Pararhodobacter sp.]|uniref:aldehyde dehydrogenase family protein n=1 Tax=Pararhodobacter sp. TaxID=2127056 RepID=UPI002FDE45A6
MQRTKRAASGGGSAAQQAGVLCGGAPLDAPGFFYAPTILDRVTNQSPAVLEEIFVPVLTFQRFTDGDAAATLADHPVYGLCAGIYTRDLSRALRRMRRIEGGTV